MQITINIAKSAWNLLIPELILSENLGPSLNTAKIFLDQTVQVPLVQAHDSVFYPSHTSGMLQLVYSFILRFS